jgi:predicted nucleotidyltransferase
MQLSKEQTEAIRTWASRTSEVRAVWLFGSRAKGTAQPDSDVDLAIECDIADYCFERESWINHLSTTLGLVVQIESPGPTDSIVAPAVADHGILLCRKSG